MVITFSLAHARKHWRLILTCASALLLVALLGFQAGTTLPPRRQDRAFLRLPGRGWCELRPRSSPSHPCADRS